MSMLWMTCTMNNHWCSWLLVVVRVLKVLNTLCSTHTTKPRNVFRTIICDTSYVKCDPHKFINSQFEANCKTYMPTFLLPPPPWRVSLNTTVDSYNRLLVTCTDQQHCSWKSHITTFCPGVKPLSEKNAEILLIGPLGTNFSEILIEIYTF